MRPRCNVLIDLRTHFASSVFLCVLPLLRLTLRIALCQDIMVVADLRALQCLAQTLLEAVNQLASGSVPLPPPQFTLSSSMSRRRRRQATLRKLFAASVRDRTSASEDKALQVAMSNMVQAESGSWLR